MMTVAWITLTLNWFKVNLRLIWQMLQIIWKPLGRAPLRGVHFLRWKGKAGVFVDGIWIQHNFDAHIICWCKFVPPIVRWCLQCNQVFAHAWASGWSRTCRNWPPARIKSGSCCWIIYYGRFCNLFFYKLSKYTFNLKTDVIYIKDAMDDAHEVPNHVRIVRERLPRPHLANYEAKRKQSQVWKEAAALWARGIPWLQALNMVSQAFSESTD